MPMPITRAGALLVLTVSVAACAPTPNRSLIAVAPTPISDARYRDAVGVRGRIVIGETYLRATELDAATIQFTPVGAGVPVTGRSGPDGAFALGPVPAGAYTLTVGVARDTGVVEKTVTTRLRPVQLTIPPGGGRLDLTLLVRYLPGSTRSITAVDLIEPRVE
jgi:hypothetical protein